MRVLCEQKDPESDGIEPDTCCFLAGHDGACSFELEREAFESSVEEIERTRMQQRRMRQRVG
jgi:hypothetical protein